MNHLMKILSIKIVENIEINDIPDISNTENVR